MLKPSEKRPNYTAFHTLSFDCVRLDLRFSLPTALSVALLVVVLVGHQSGIFADAP